MRIAVAFFALLSLCLAAGCTNPTSTPSPNPPVKTQGGPFYH